MKRINMYHSILPPQYVSRMVHPNTKKNLDKWVNLNDDLDIKQEIWVDSECRVFLKEFGESFGLDILKWYNYESDGRYKSDIWRICVLYENGGIYVDVDQEPLTKISDYLDFDRFNICVASNMGLHNVSNGFIYTEKKSEIIKNNIIEMVRVYENNLGKGGCHVMGRVITEMTGGEPLKMPLGEIKIGYENCLFLHEIGDETIPDGTQAFYNSFGLYSDNDTKRVMNSRYESYHTDRHNGVNFIKI
tara:strand:- start:3153 stop:3890 length:738 start_codon:yes stop_codon:yes gene_type:complete